MLTDKLKKFRKENHLTQEELAEKLYVSRSTVAKWEQGRGIPDRANLSELSKFMGIEEDELLEEDEAINVIESVEKLSHKKTKLLLAVFLPLILILILSLSLSLYYRTKGGSIIAKSVSPDGNIKLTVYDNAETLDGKTEKYGYKIEVGGAYKGTWIKKDCEFVGLYWSYDSRYVVEAYYSRTSRQNWLEYTDFKNNSGVNLQSILSNQLAGYYSISEAHMQCNFDFVQWSDEENIMLIKFNMVNGEENVSGYFWSSPHLFDELSGLTEISRTPIM